MEKLSKADLEKEAILNPEKAEKRRQMRRRARLMAVITVLCVFCVVCTTVLMVVRAWERAALEQGRRSGACDFHRYKRKDKVKKCREGGSGTRIRSMSTTMIS